MTRCIGFHDIVQHQTLNALLNVYVTTWIRKIIEMEVSLAVLWQLFPSHPNDFRTDPIVFSGLLAFPSSSGYCNASQSGGPSKKNWEFDLLLHLVLPEPYVLN